MKVKLKSIKFKLMFGGVMLVVVPLIVVSWLSYSKSYRAIYDISTMQSQATATDLANLVSNTLTAEINQANIMASQRGIIKLSTSIDEFGLDGIPSEYVIEMFTDLKQQFNSMGKHYQGIFLADTKGLLYTGILDTGKEYKGSNISKRPYFLRAKTEGKTVVSEIVISKSTGRPISVICVPIKSIAGKFVGALGMVIKAEFFTNLVASRKFGDTGYGYMINGKGIVIGHPNEKFVLKLNVTTIKEMADITGRMLSGETGIEAYTFKGVDKLAGYGPVGINGWSVAVTQNADEFKAASNNIRNSNLIVTILAACLAAVLLLSLARTIVHPINSAVKGLKDIAQGEGDLTVRLEVKGDDEVSELGTWFNTFIDKLQQIIKQIADSVETLSNHSTDLSSVSQLMADGSEQASQKAHSVATAAEEMTTNMNSVSAAMEESSTNATMVASAAEEMNSTISEIAQNAEKARQVSDQAVSKVTESTEAMDVLSQAAHAIGKVVETITEISEQVNLLALNATIEAARAGEAGKGFAVVANEIKDLAKQTSEATTDIKSKITNIQDSANGTMTGISEISKVITNVNDIVGTIASAVEEQSATTGEIANNISQASTGIQEVNENVNQSSKVAEDITREITEVNQSSGEMASSSNQVKISAGELSDLSDHLNDMVNRFKV